jgi:hypothetical protein
MPNLKTGRNEPYVEIWRRFPTESGPFCVLERVGGRGKAYVGRVGRRALGIAMDEDGKFYGWGMSGTTRVGREYTNSAIPSCRLLLRHLRNGSKVTKSPWE